jgi:cell fate regulator YaaT (PSP1 superfamily)
MADDGGTNEGGGEAGGDGGGSDGGGRRRRRRRARGGGGGEGREPQQQTQQQPPQQQRQPQPQRPPQQRQPQPQRPPQQQRQPQPQRPPQQQRQPDRPVQPERQPQPQPPRPQPADDDHDVHDSPDDRDDAPVEHVAWGTDDGAPAPAITLAADLPAEPELVDDPDPVSRVLVDAPAAPSHAEVANLAGLRFAVGGRLSWLDAGEAAYATGDRVIADSDRGPRLAWVAVPPARRPLRERNPRRILRRATDDDLRGESDADADRIAALRAAKDAAAELRLALKVFRVEVGRGKLVVYYTADDRVDVRDFVRVLGRSTSARVELRQLGARDEAKAVGGIGTCGLTLCCTTWLPDFVPVSIKMAKDQGLVLAPNKVAGQCGRLKCCLVYEQAAYAELRKGLPKLGKRVIAPRGEGRVVEVDVLRQRIRVSYAPGDTEVLPAAEVRPMFPPAGGRPGQPGPGPEPEPDEPDDDDAVDPSLPT